MAYKPTLFDRHGPDAGPLLQAWGYGLLIFGLTTATLMARIGFRWWEVPLGAALGLLGGGAGWFIGGTIGKTWKSIAVDGSSTPYERQFSYEQALVAQGRTDEALRSLEVVIAAEPSLVAARIKAAELYIKEKANYRRAAELFREVSCVPSAAIGDHIYVTNRLVDLYLGPLNDRGRAMVELRRLVDRWPRSTAADHARLVLADLKSRMNVEYGEQI